MKSQFKLTIWALLVGCAVAAMGGTAPAIIPKPVQMELKEGAFTLTGKTRILYSGFGVQATAGYLATMLQPATGMSLPVKRKTFGSDNSILLTLQGADPSLGAEGYELTVTPKGVVIKAQKEAGLFYGCQSLRQLLPTAIFADSVQAGVSWTIPAVQIRDMPRYAWRGLMLDSCRHFLPVPFVKKFIDLLALQKMNTLHWHLTDDQGWRIEIKKYPRLTEVGSIRSESPVHGNRNKGDGVPYGPFFYTQDQIRDVVAYAASRHVTVVPEIEMPGHALGALTAYPELSCTGGPFKPRTRWGVEGDVYCAGNDRTIQFNKDVLTEVMGLFPGSFLHIGGDECPKDRWNRCPKCKARMADKGLKSAHELQSWFVRQMVQFTSDHGRRLIGWDEILEGGMAPGAAVMSWRGVNGGIQAASEGHDVVMCPGSHCYLDHAQSHMPGEPEAIGGYLPLAQVYSYEPTPAKLEADKKKHIMGVQGNLWSEYLWEPKDVEYFGYPRACALSEVAWTPADKKNFGDFWSRLEQHVKRLDLLKVNYRHLSPDQK